MNERFSLQPQQVPILEHFGFIVEDKGNNEYIVIKDGQAVQTHDQPEGVVNMVQIQTDSAVLTIGWSPRKNPPAHPKTIIMGDITKVAEHILEEEE